MNSFPRYPLSGAGECLNTRSSRKPSFGSWPRFAPNSLNAAAQESFGEALELVGSRYAEILAQHRALQIVCAALYVELSARGDRPETGLGDMLERLRTGVVRASARSGLSPRLASAAIAAVEEVVETAKHMGETG
jgi:hypothetical protein